MTPLWHLSESSKLQAPSSTLHAGQVERKKLSITFLRGMVWEVNAFKWNDDHFVRK